MQDIMTIAQYGKQYNCETLLERVLNFHDVPMIYRVYNRAAGGDKADLYHVTNITSVLQGDNGVAMFRQCYINSPIIIDSIDSIAFLQLRYASGVTYSITHLDHLIKYICYYNYRYQFIGGQKLIDLASEMTALSDGSVIDLGLLAYK